MTIGWLTQGKLSTIKPSLSSLKSGLASRSGGCQSSHRRKPPWLTKERFVAGGAAAGGVVLGIRLRFHHHTPKQLAIRLAFHQQAADEVGGNLLGGAAEEGLWECLGKRGGYELGCYGLGGYGSGLKNYLSLA